MSFLIDFHVHSINSKDGTASLEEIAYKAKEKGLNGVCICDHNVQTLKETVQIDGVYLFPGIEITAQTEHILGILPEVPIDVKDLNASGKPSSDAVIACIHEHGGIAVLAHPFGHPAEEEWTDENLNIKPDAIEVYNSRSWMVNPDANFMAENFANSNKLPALGGSDAHIVDEIGNSYTEVLGVKIYELKNAIMLGNIKPVFVENTRRIYKGKSQFTRGRRSKSIPGFFKGLWVYLQCLILDISKK